MSENGSASRDLRNVAEDAGPEPDSIQQGGISAVGSQVGSSGGVKGPCFWSGGT